jgi:esterase/lipase superfamily enzyme
MYRLAIALIGLLLMFGTARADEDFCALPFTEQIHNRKVQEFLVVSGLLNSEIGHTVDAELRRAMGWLRQGQSTPPDAPLSADECRMVGEKVDAFHRLARFREWRLAYNELVVLFPDGLGPGARSAVELDKLQREQSWVDYDESDWSFGIDVFRSSLYKDTPATLQSGYLTHWKKVTLFYLQNSFEEAAAEGFGDFTHLLKQPVVVRYFFHNLAFEHRGAVRGMYLKFSLKPPDWFEIPDFLRPTLSVPDLVQVMRGQFGEIAEREVAWLLFCQAVTNIVVSHFKTNNGWRKLSLSAGPQHAGCALNPVRQVPDGFPVRVIFGTTRKPTGHFLDASKRSSDQLQNAPDTEDLFGADPDELLHLGCAQLEVSRPPSTSPASWLGINKQDQSRSMVQLRGVSHLGGIEPPDQPYVRLVDDAITTSQERALLFIHGYNTSFAWSLHRAAELAASTRYNGQVYMFSWPSRESVLDYLADLERAKSAQAALLGFLRAILQDRNVRTLDIVAHSAGCEQLLSTLERMLPTFDKRTPDPTKPDSPHGKRLRLGQVVLAAPDVDSLVFREKVAALAPFAERVTVYVSEADLALRVSRWFRSGQQRAGNFRRGELPVRVTTTARDARVHVIDATQSLQWMGGFIPRLKLGHDDFIAVPEVNRDIRLVLEGRNPKGAPTLRGSTPSGNIFCRVPYEAGTNEAYWVMRQPPSDGGKLGACPDVARASEATAN